MNERVKELAEQAWEVTAVSPDFGHPVSFAEKFAELIIKECLNQCYNRGTNNELYAGQLMAGAYIEQHFGVSE